MKKIQKWMLICFLFIVLINTTHALQPPYEPTHESLSKHPLPEWYQDAKFGIIIYYGIYTVPAWAPLFNPTGRFLTKEFFLNNPYPEWYANTIQIKESPSYQYHVKNYGENFKYDDFVPLFNQELQKWDPDKWAKLFATSGAKYVVFVTKHHDGFLLWPSQYRNPYKPNFIASRDVAGELTKAVRKHNMHMGFYYSAGFDWSWPDGFNQPIVDLVSAFFKIPQSKEYADYVFYHFQELIDKYKPDLLWNDIVLPTKVNKWQLFANFYNQIPEGVMNNRWGQGEAFDGTIIGQPPDFLVDFQLKTDWFDFYSLEYLSKYFLTRHKWEADYGIGYAFGYNSEEYLHPEHLKTLDQLIEDLVDIVSKNGNLLLGIGPKADGTITEYQTNLLLGIGDWLDKNGEAIYGSRTWKKAEGIVQNGTIPVRFTLSKDKKFLYIILLKNPQDKDVVLNDFRVRFKKMEVLNGKNPIEVNWTFAGKNPVVKISEAKNIPLEHPIIIKLERVVT